MRTEAAAGWYVDYASLRILGFSVAEGPILFLNFHQVDQDVFSAKFQFLIKPIRHSRIKALLGLERAAGVQRDLQENAVVRALDAQVGAVELQTRSVMFGDHLKSVVLGDAERIGHCAIHDLSNLLAICGGFAFE